MSIYKRGDVWWYKFMWQGELIRESTKQGNDKQARKMEAAHRTALANGLVGIREKKLAPTLGEFLRKDFLPYMETKHKGKPNTLRLYRDGINNMLGKSFLASLRLDEINDQRVQQYVAQRSHLSPSRINTALRLLKTAINLAVEWGKLESAPHKIHLVKGERRRERVLTNAELAKYLDACPQPWKDAATIIADQGFRPGEVLALDWRQILLGGDRTGLVAILDGKSRAARRTLPMTPRVHELLTARYKATGKPEQGWVFPSRSSSGHLSPGTVQTQHRAALASSGVTRFESYCLRHTALTQLATAGVDAFTLSRIAGHSSITMTQRYCHPQADAIERAFQAAHPPLRLAAAAD